MRTHNIYRLSLIVLMFLILNQLKAQDASFSQNYASPLYLSPSFTGLTEGSRLALNYRDQWPNIPGTYKTMAFSFDHYFADYNSGIGLLYYRDDQGIGKIVNQNVGILYAYEVYVSDDIMIRPGIQFKYAQTLVNPSSTYFGDQMGASDGSINTGGSMLNSEQTNKFDAAASVMVYSNFYWGGVTVDHLVKSDIGYTDIETSKGMKLTAFGGFKWVYKSGRRIPDQSISFAFNYRQQQDFSQLDFGAYWMYNPIEIGLWYRGLPVKNAEQLSNSDAIIAIFGVNLGKVRLGYSFDLTLSDLAGNTGGAHEFSIMYTIPSSSKPRINRSAIPCSQPGYSGGGPSRSKYRSRSRSIF